jgi:hypothetical protein
VGLRAETVYLVRLDLVEERDEPRPVAEVAVVQEELVVRCLRRLVDVVDTIGVEAR